MDSYVYILNVRFVGEIRFQKRIEDEWLSLRIPSMILQPIVENSVNYGIRNISWEGLIELSVYRNGKYVCISIKDNGIGMTRERIDQILNGNIEEDSSEKNSNGIGLGNVISRLKLYFDEDDLITINSEGENKGTEVIIYIPIRDEVQDREKYHV